MYDGSSNTAQKDNQKVDGYPFLVQFEQNNGDRTNESAKKYLGGRNTESMVNFLNKKIFNIYEENQYQIEIDDDDFDKKVYESARPAFL